LREDVDAGSCAPALLAGVARRHMLVLWGFSQYVFRQTVLRADAACESTPKPAGIRSGMAEDCSRDRLRVISNDQEGFAIKVCATEPDLRARIPATVELLYDLKQCRDGLPVFAKSAAATRRRH